MSATSIEWTERTWNPVRGCSRTSPGCTNCYAEIMAARFSDPGMWGHGFAERTASGARWTRAVSLIPEKLGEPLSWRKPALVFVNSTSDLFHESLSNEDIAAVFGVMAACPHLTFQVLTKRASRMAEWFRWLGQRIDELLAVHKSLRPHSHWYLADLIGAAEDILDRLIVPEDEDETITTSWPLPNVWLGVSVENQEYADERIPHLLSCPAAVKFLSCEPLLGPVDLRRIVWGPGGLICGVLPDETEPDDWRYWARREGGVSWVICGGESGHGARAMHPSWPKSLRDQCVAAGVPFFFKQWGEFTPYYEAVDEKERRIVLSEYPGGAMKKVGKKAAGRLLDGRTWDEMPREEVARG